MKNIISAVDFSIPSGNALKEAHRVAREEHAHLTVAHIVDCRVLEALEDRITIDEGEIIAETEKRLRAFIADTLGPDGKDFELHVTKGHPFDELLKVVKQRDAVLLVMGSHGSVPDPDRVGVIASKCVRKAPVDVFMIRERLHGQPFGKIVACIDFSENSRKAAEKALHIGKRDGAPVEFLNIYQPLGGMFPVADYTTGAIPVIADSEMIEHFEQKLNEFIEPIVAEFPGVAHTQVVGSCTSVARGITDHVNECGADLLVLGTRGRTGLKVLLLGTTAEKAIHNCTCSTLAVKPDDFHYEHA